MGQGDQAKGPETGNAPLWRAAAALGLPLLRLLPAETAHGLTLRALAAGAAPARPAPDHPSLATTFCGLTLPNPLGLAAGFDKNALAAAALHRWGFGHVEVGTLTPRPQPGNPRPRLFRLPEDQAVINRMGFNNEGFERALLRLSEPRGGILGVNLGKNRDSEDAVADYVAGVERLGLLADYLVINVSSPNTPGLRDLQRRDAALQLVSATIAARDGLASARPPVLLKIAPDLDDAGIEEIAEVVALTGIDGLVVSNTTVARPPGLRSRHAHEAGGLSGRPLFAPSTALLQRIHRATGGRVPLIGVGGVASGADAYAKIRAGATLVQLYTALVYHGPALVQRIKDELAASLARDGFASVAEAVGSAAENR